MRASSRRRSQVRLNCQPHKRRKARCVVINFKNTLSKLEIVRLIHDSSPALTWLVSRLRSSLCTEGGEAPGWQGAKSEHIGNM